MSRLPVAWRLPRRFEIAAWLLAVVSTSLVCAAEKKTGTKGEQASSPAADHAALEFFETKVRPLLADNCFECHSGKSKALQAGLRLDSRASMLDGGDSSEAVVVPGKPNESPLVHAIRWETSEMPPRGKLRDEQIAVLVKWIEMGAPWPEGDSAAAPEKTTVYDWKALRSAHWAWQPIREPALPAVRNGDWPQNEIDAFVLARLETAGLAPLAAGNSPGVGAADLFRSARPAADARRNRGLRESAQLDRPAAIAELVDRLLASPHYGERWARHWLDVARYSEGHGGALDNATLAGARRYRDWVVEALNRNLPFDEFVRRQLAGDLIAPEHAVATGFLALGPAYISDGGDPESVAMARAETLDDRVDTVARGLLGVTVSCAPRRHDHKFDPVPQLDYYSLAGVFRNTRTRDMPLASPQVVKAFDDHQRQVRELNEKIRTLRKSASKAERQLTENEQDQVARWTAELSQLEKRQPPKYSVVHTIADADDSDMPLAVRGNPLKPGPRAPRRFLRIVAGDDPPQFTQGSGRLELAAAITSRDNPLTARVFVNRVWLWHFGQALVRTPSNFGKLGEKPTHPELLDWLAHRFISDSDQGLHGSLKRLHRLILTSAAYQMQSDLNPQAFAADADNRLLWRMNPRRLDVEAWRDALLSATGELDTKVGGESVSNITKSPRRTLYAAISRSGEEFKSDTFLRLFDFPQSRSTSEGRTASIVPQQSLFMLNSPFMAARARALADRLEREAPSNGALTNEARIALAYRLLYGRAASRDELQLGLEFLAAPMQIGDEQLSAWQQYAQVLLSANELMYLE